MVFLGYVMSRTGMYHLNAMFFSNLDDLVSCQVCPNRSVLTAFTNHVGFVGFCK